MLGGRGSRSLYKNLSKERKLMMVCTSNVYPNCGVDTPAGTLVQFGNHIKTTSLILFLLGFYSLSVC